MRGLFGNIAVAFVCSFLLIACGGEQTEKVEPPKDDKKELNTEGEGILHVGNKLFSVPSPLEISLLIKKSNIDFNNEILSPIKKAEDIPTQFHRSIALGVFGADLGYAMLFKQNQLTIDYLTTVKDLGTSIGLSDNLYVDLMKRFEGNMDNPDSLMIFVSEAQKAADSYLEKNQNKHLADYILVGGWLESIHFASKLVDDSEMGQKIKMRIGEQKKTVKNIVSLLYQSPESEERDKLVEEMEALQKIYDDVKVTYNFVEPETDAASKTTIIKSTTSFEYSNETLEAIGNKVGDIKTKMIQ